MAHKPPAGWRVERLDPKRDRGAFQCGVESLDRYFKQQATQDAKRRAATTYALIDPDTNEVAGYYTLSATHLEAGDVPPDLAKKLPRYPRLPATLIGRLAIDLRYRGRDLGRALLLDAVIRCWEASEGIGSIAVVVEALDERAAVFYERFGFRRLPGHERTLFLPMRTVELLLAGDEGAGA